MKILALETSAKSVSTAVVENGAPLAYAYQCTGLTHSRTLMPMVDAMLKNAELTLGEGMSTYILGSDDPDDIRRFAEVAAGVREAVEAARRAPAGAAPATAAPRPRTRRRGGAGRTPAGSRA